MSHSAAASSRFSRIMCILIRLRGQRKPCKRYVGIVYGLWMGYRYGGGGKAWALVAVLVGKMEGCVCGRRWGELCKGERQLSDCGYRRRNGKVRGLIGWRTKSKCPLRMSVRASEVSRAWSDANGRAVRRNLPVLCLPSRLSSTTTSNSGDRRAGQAAYRGVSHKSRYGCFFSAWRCRGAAFRVVRRTLALPKVEELPLMIASRGWLWRQRAAEGARSAGRANWLRAREAVKTEAKCEGCESQRAGRCRDGAGTRFEGRCPGRSSDR